MREQYMAALALALLGGMQGFMAWAAGQMDLRSFQAMLLIVSTMFISTALIIATSRGVHRD